MNKQYNIGQDVGIQSISVAAEDILIRPENILG